MSPDTRLPAEGRAAGPGLDPGWLDAIIDPLDGLVRGRHPGLDPGWISMGIEAAQQAPATREFNMGVLQT